MLTKCPHCNTVFRLRPEQLSAASGKVRCGQCHSVFNATQHLVEERPPQPAAGASSSPAPSQMENWAPSSGETTAGISSHQSAAPKPAAPEPAAPEPAAPEPAASEPAASEPAAPEPAASEPAAPTDTDDLSTQLDHLFSEIDQTAESSAAEAAKPRTAAVRDDSFGESQIETLLTPEAGPEEPVLPWHQEEPATTMQTAAAAADTAGGPTRLPDMADDEVAEFDLPEAGPNVAPPSDDTPSAPPPTFSEITSSPRGSSWAAFGWAIAAMLALATLVGQYAYLNSADLVRYTQLRPALEQLCHYTGCTVPPRRDVRDITLLERDIRSSNKYQGVLVISATMVNRAPFAQPYPYVEVAMHDVDGNVVASRLFHPREYLPLHERRALFAPGATTHLALRVADPGPAAVGFEFTFY